MNNNVTEPAPTPISPEELLPVLHSTDNTISGNLDFTAWVDGSLSIYSLDGEGDEIQEEPVLTLNASQVRELRRLLNMPNVCATSNIAS